MRQLAVALACVGLSVAGAATVSTDYLDYRPGSTVQINGAGFAAGEMIELQVQHLGFAADTNQPAYQAWYLEANTTGGFRSTWVVPLDPDVVGATFLLTAKGLSSQLQAGATFTDGNVGIDFTQFANESGNLQWLNGTLNANNSTYTEGMSVPQRLILNDITPANVDCNGNPNAHCLTFKVLATKGGFHAYDFLTSWQQGVVAADTRIAPGMNLMAGLAGFHCGDLGNPYAGICTTLHAASNYLEVLITGDEINNTLTLNGITDNVGNRIQIYENLFGERTARVYADAPISNASFVFLGYEPGSGETYSVYRLCWESTATQVILEVAGHLSQTTDEGQLLSYPDTGGSANVNGGPYHFKLVEFDCGATGNQDNQIQGGEIMPQPRCVINIGLTNTCAGNGITLIGSILAGKPPFTFKWISPENNYTNVIVTNAMSVAITVYEPGTYSLMITDDNGLTSPDPCDAVITAIPRTVASGLTNLNLCAGATAVFCTTASGGAAQASGDFSFVWTKNGLPLLPGGNVQINSTSNSSCLILTDVGGGDTANYCVKVTGECNTVTNCATLVVNAQNPVILCAPPKNVECGNPLTFDPPSTTNGTPVIVSTITNASGFCGDTFSVTRTWRVVDTCGRTNECSQTVTVVDTTPPMVNCPTNKSVACGTPWQFDVPTASDICGTNSVTILETVTNQLCGNTFSATRTYVVRDACGNAAQCGQTVTVIDETPPIITCVSNKLVECGTPWTFDVPSAEDGCGTNAITIVRTQTNSACGSTFTATRTWRARDACGNQAECQQTVTVLDTTAPEISCPTNLTVQCLGNVPAPRPNTVSADDCGSVTNLWAGDTRQTNACVITITRLYRAIDACGNSNSCQQVITVQDTIAPQLTGVPVNQVVACLNEVPPLPNVTATDNCLGSLTPVHSGSTNGACPTIILRQWVATDLCGNAVTNSYTITVNDTLPPVLVGVPTNQTFQCLSDLPPIPTVTATDNCGPVTPTLVSVTNGSCPTIITRTWTVKDGCTNTASASRTITILDTIPPVLVGVPTNQTFQCLSDLPPVPSVTATDNCGPVTPTLVSVTNGSCPTIITRTWTVKDGCTNTASAIRTITILDTIPPVLVGVPANTNYLCLADVPPPANVTATDNCDGAIPVSLTVLTNGSCPMILTYIWRAEDRCTNSASATRTVTVNDTIPPVLVGVPANTNYQCLADVPAPGNVTATDNCGPVTPTLVSLTNGSCPTIITRTWTVRDACTNTASASQTITVNDTIPPVLVGVPTNQTVQCLAQVPTPPVVTATDNCGAGAVQFSATTNASCPTIITWAWTVKDACTNSASATRTVTVNDTSSPVMTVGTTNKTVECTLPWTFDAPQFVDACGSVTITNHTVTNAACGNTFSATRTWVARDQCNNPTNVSQTVTVIDTTPPSITCPTNLTVQCFGDIPAPDPGLVVASDTCGAITNKAHVSDSYSTNACIITVTRVYRATDACGNSSTCAQTITVADTLRPQIAGVPANLGISCLSQVPALPAVSATDNCGPVTLVHSGSTNGSCPTIITRTWAATDLCGNTTNRSYTITVHDTNAPTITISTTNKNVECGTAWEFNPPTFADNCGSVTVTNSTVTNAACGNTFAATRIWFARDLCNNLTTTAQIVTVRDTTPPGVICPTNKTVECTLPWAFDPPTPLPDACGTNRVEIVGTSTNASCGNTFSATRTWRIFDACGNFATCQQTVTVLDTTPPVIFCPTNITVQCVSLIPAPDPLGVISSDTCGAITNKLWVRDTRVTNGCMITLSRVYRATDACGNQAECTQTITVLDTIPPVITCSTNRSVECGQPWEFFSPSATDNCQLMSVSSALTFTNATCGNTFVATRVWRALDQCGNAAYCTNVVTVVDTTPPTAIWAANRTNQCTQPVVFTPPTSITDLCSSTYTVVVTASNVMTTDGLNRLVQTRCWRVYDACSNYVEGCQSVTIENCAVEYCSLTQGAYGNSGGKFNGLQRPQLIQKLLTVPGTVTNSWDIVLGKPGRSMRFTRDSVSCIIQRLPAGGPAAAFPEFGNATLLPDLCQTSPPMPTDRKGVKFRNQLFAQGLTLNLNARLSTNLLSLVLTNPVTGNRICTMGALPGPDGKIGTSDDELDTKGPNGIELDGDEVKSWTFPSSVINTLKNDPTLGVTGAGLIELINRGLAGQSTGSASLSDIAGAAGTINEAFDECRFLVPCQ